MKSISKTRKTDGRKNNGGARKGAGRPFGSKHVTDKQFQRFMQAFLDDEYYNEQVLDLALIDGQMRWILKSRFEYMVDQQLKFGMGLKKGHKRAFNILKKTARVTQDPEKRKWRLVYLENAVEDAQDALKLAEKKNIERWRSTFVRPDEGTTAYQIYLAQQKKIQATPYHIDKNTGRKVWHEHAWQTKMGEGIEKYFRNRERHVKDWGW